jgi:hypothetical protein
MLTIRSLPKNPFICIAAGWILEIVPCSVQAQRRNSLPL